MRRPSVLGESNQITQGRGDIPFTTPLRDFGQLVQHVE